MTTKASACHFPDCRGFFRSLLGWDAGLGRKSGPLRSGPNNACLWREGVLSEQKCKVDAPPRASKPSINRWGQFPASTSRREALTPAFSRAGGGPSEWAQDYSNACTNSLAVTPGLSAACPLRNSPTARLPRSHGPALSERSLVRASDAFNGQPRGCPGGSRSATGCRTGSRCGQISASRLYTSGRNCNVPSLSTYAVW